MIPNFARYNGAQHFRRLRIIHSFSQPPNLYMRLAIPLLCLAGLMEGCQTGQHKAATPQQATAKLRSPVSLCDAVLTLPSDALSGLTERQEFLRADYYYTTDDERLRRISFSSDNVYEGVDAKSMFYLRLFEDESGHTIAASHAARPFADNSKPSEVWTRVYRLVDGAWVDITATAFSAAVPRDGYFRFDRAGDSVAYGLYTLKPRRDGRGDCYDFGPQLGHIEWRDGAYHVNHRAN